MNIQKTLLLAFFVLSVMRAHPALFVFDCFYFSSAPRAVSAPSSIHIMPNHEHFGKHNVTSLPVVASTRSFYERSGPAPSPRVLPLKDYLPVKKFHQMKFVLPGPFFDVTRGWRSPQLL